MWGLKKIKYLPGLEHCCLFQNIFVEPKTSNKWTTRSSFEPPLRLSLRFVTWQCAERLKKLYYWSVPSSYWSESSNLIGRRSRDFDKNENGTWSVLLRKAECLVKDIGWVQFLWRRPTSRVNYWHVFHFNSVLRGPYSWWLAQSLTKRIFKETEEKLRTLVNANIWVNISAQML